MSCESLCHGQSRTGNARAGGHEEVVDAVQDALQVREPAAFVRFVCENSYLGRFQSEILDDRESSLKSRRRQRQSTFELSDDTSKGPTPVSTHAQKFDVKHELLDADASGSIRDGLFGGGFGTRKAFRTAQYAASVGASAWHAQRNPPREGSGVLLSLSLSLSLAERVALGARADSRTSASKPVSTVGCVSKVLRAFTKQRRCLTSSELAHTQRYRFSSRAFVLGLFPFFFGKTF